MEETDFESGFLEPIEGLTFAQLDRACEAAFQNAIDLLAEADTLRAEERCARAYFLAHIACEELGKLPILANVAVSLRLGWSVDWRRIDRMLRSHDAKIRQTLFLDSVVAQTSLKEGVELYEADLKRLPMYLDTKNASLYSFFVEGDFTTPQAAIPCEVFDALRGLAGGRLRAFEGMYIRLIRETGGLERFLSGERWDRTTGFVERLTGAEGREAYEVYAETGDESKIDALFERLLSPPEPTSS